MMTYSEFKETYRYMVREYPSTTGIFSDTPEKNIILTETHFEKHGTKWKETDSKTESVDFITYANTVDAIPFFRGLGGREIVKQTYTKRGYIPTEINSISPSRTEKTVRRFKFI